MANKYIQTIRTSGSPNFLNDLIRNVSGGQLSSTNDLASSIQKVSRVQTKRMDNITALSEKNMEILEQDLVLLDKVLRTYNTVGYIAGTTAALGTILLAMKLKSKLNR
jgi:hypothetical protein